MRQAFTQQEYKLRITMRTLVLDEGTRDMIGVETIDKLEIFKTVKHLQVMWDWLSRYFDAGIPPSFETMEVELVGAAEEGQLTDTGYDQLTELLEYIFHNEEKLNIPFTQQWLRMAIAEKMQTALQNKLVEDSFELEELQSLMADHKDAAVDPFHMPREENFVDKLPELMRPRETTPTGLFFMDEVMGGGMYPAEMTALIIPSGGGKSTAALQISGHQVLQSNHVAYVSTEQGLEGDFIVRIGTLATRQSAKLFAGGYEALSPDLRLKFDAVMTEWQKYFHFFDLNKDENKITSITQLTKMLDHAFYDQGIEPSLIIIDWWGLLKDMLLDAAQKRAKDATGERRLSRLIIQELRAWVKKRKARLIIFHQLGGAASAKSPGKIQSSHDAQEDKNFNNQFDFAFVGSKKDPHTNIVKFNADKARRAANCVISAKLNGDLWRFERLSRDEAGDFLNTAEGNYASMIVPDSEMAAMPRDSYED